MKVTEFLESLGVALCHYFVYKKQSTNVRKYKTIEFWTLLDQKKSMARQSLREVSQFVD
jgi:hypothetical protein